MDSNRAAFRKWSILPRMLQGNTHRDLSVELFGKKYPSPVLMAPVGVNKIVSMMYVSLSRARLILHAVPFVSEQVGRSVEAVLSQDIKVTASAAWLEPVVTLTSHSSCPRPPPPQSRK